MKRMTRILALLLSVVMMFSAVPLSALADTTGGSMVDAAVVSETNADETGKSNEGKEIVDLGWYPNEVKIPIGSITEFKLPSSAEVVLTDKSKTTVNFTGWTVTDESNTTATINLTKTGVYYYTPDVVSSYQLAEGVSFTMKVEVTETQISYYDDSTDHVLLNGIPAVINTDENGEGTYIYDATGMNIIYFNEDNTPKDISNVRLYGGQCPEELDDNGDYLGTTIESASVVMLGGTLTNIIGGAGRHISSSTTKYYPCTVKNVSVKMYDGTLGGVYLAGLGVSGLGIDFLPVAENMEFYMYGGTITGNFALAYYSLAKESAHIVLEGGSIASFFAGSYLKSTVSAATVTAEVEVFVGEDVAIGNYYSEGRYPMINKATHHIPKNNKIENLFMRHPGSAGVINGQHFYLEDVEQLEQFDTLDNSKSEVHFYIDGVETKIISEIVLDKTEYVVENGTVKENIGLPTSFVVGGETVEGFTWEGTYEPTVAGTYTLKLVPPVGYYLVKEAVVTAEVKKAVLYTVQSVDTQNDAVSVLNGTIFADVVLQLPTQFSANGGTLTPSNSVYEWVCENYSPYVPGDYVFEALFTDGEYVYADGVSPYRVTVTVAAPLSSGKTVTSIDLPVNYTVLTQASGVHKYIDEDDGTLKEVNVPISFYEELDVVLYENGIPTDTKITGIEWEGTETGSDEYGTYYVYTIKSFAEQSEGVVIPDDVLADAKITAYKLSSYTYSNASDHFRGVGYVVIPVTLSLSGYEAYSGSTTLLGYDGIGIYDATGCVNVNSKLGFSQSLKFYGGNNKDVTGNPSITVNGGVSIGTLHGGGKEFDLTGDATITLNKNSTVTGDVTAGTFNADFKGSSTINVRSGATVEGSIIAASTNGKFDGEVIINIEEGAKVGGISLGNVPENSATSVSVYATSGFDVSLVQGLDTGKVKLYVDGEQIFNVSEVKMPEKVVYSVALGTGRDNIGLPTTLSATINQSASVIENVTWVCDNYDSATAGKYVFTPVIPENYNLKCETDNIKIIVRVLTGNAVQTITKFEPINPILVSYATPEESINLPETVTATVGGQSMQVEVDLWSCDNYNGMVNDAEYTFTAVISAEYAMGQLASPTVTVKITKASIVEIYLPVTKTTFPRGAVQKPVFYDTLSVKLDNGEVIEVSGFEWSVESYNKDIVGTYLAKIKKVPSDFTIASSVSLPQIEIEVAKFTYQSDSGICLNAIPTVIDEGKGEDGTYLYDITGCNKTYPNNISTTTIIGGGPSNCQAFKTTMIEVRGGTVSAVIAGSRRAGQITDTAYVYVLGGQIGSIYSGGSGVKSSEGIAVCQNTYTYVDNAIVTSKICGAGYHGKVLGDVTIIVKNTSVPSIMSGSYSTGQSGRVLGNATIKLLDGANVNRVLCAGRKSLVKAVEVYISNKATIRGQLIPSGLSFTETSVKIFYEKGFDLANVYVDEENVKLYEGHFEADRETFVTEREIRVARRPGLIRSDFYVDYGTTLENIGLPTSFTAEVDGVPTTIEGISYEPVNGYNGNVPGRYQFKLKLPDDCVIPITSRSYTEKITVVVSDNNQGGNITEILAENTGYTLANGTAKENIGLPSVYNVMIAGTTKKTVPVKSWKVTDETGNAVSYDAYEAGTYVFTPDFGSAYTVDSNAVVPTHTVKILKLKPFYNIKDNTFMVSLVGVPSEHKSSGGVQYAYDKAGNYLAMTTATMLIYGGAISNSYEATTPAQTAEDYVIESTDITFNSGSTSAIYGGSREVEITGKIKVTINGGSVTSVYGGNRGSTHNGSEVIVNGGSISNVYAGVSSNYGSSYIEVNGGTISNVGVGLSSSGSIYGTPQEKDEVLATDSQVSDDDIVVKKGEMISAVYVQNGGTVKTLSSNYSSSSINEGSVKMYLNGGSVTTLNGAGYGESSKTNGNVYIKVSENAECKTIFASASGYVEKKVYVIVPDDFNRFNILGWNEETLDDSDQPGFDDDYDAEYGEDEETTEVEVVVSGGYYVEETPIRLLTIGSTKTVFGRGVPMRIEGNILSDEDEPDLTTIPTYISYFDVNYDEATEEPETFRYETYVDEEGEPIVLKGVWRKLDEDVKGFTVYAGTRKGISSKYPSTYVEFKGGYIPTLYGGSQLNVPGTSNVILDAQGSHKINTVYGGGTSSVAYFANKAHVVVKQGEYNVIYAAGNKTATNGVLVDVLGGRVQDIYLGTNSADGALYGPAEINLENCIVGNLYGGSYGNGATTIGPVKINVKENVTFTGFVYPMGSAKLSSTVTTGAVTIKAYVTLTDSDASDISAQFKKIKYTKSQAPNIYVNGQCLGQHPDYMTATFETAKKVVAVSNGNIFLNGIPAIVTGDGAGHSNIYQIKTIDGTLDVYQKDADGNFKKDENGKRISNIVRDKETGMAVKGSLLVNVDVTGMTLYAGANGKSVEDTYVEFHQGGAVNGFYGGSLGGNTGYNAQGEEVGLVELRMFGGGVEGTITLGNENGKNVAGQSTINTKCSKSIFIGLDGSSNSIYMSGNNGIFGSEEKYLSGYYTKAGEVIEYDDPDPVDPENPIVTITGTWEDYNLNLEKSDYTEYYNASNAYFNGTGEADFLESDYYVDPYDDRYTSYCVLGNHFPQSILCGTGGSQYETALNRTYGNQYFRAPAYGLKYDAELDMFVDDYNNYKGFDSMAIGIYAGSKTGAVYSDVRLDIEGIHAQSGLFPLGQEKTGVLHFGHTYINLYEDSELHQDLLYNTIQRPNRPNITVKKNFYPRWSQVAARALDVDPVMAQLAIERGFITDTDNPKDVRTYMLSATDAAKLLNYYYTGTEEFIPYDEGVQEYEGYKNIFDASDDVGKFVIRSLDPRLEKGSGINRYTNYSSGRPGDCVLLTLPNRMTMLIDCAAGSAGPTLVRDIKYYLESAQKVGIGDGKTIDYFVITHWHADHHGAKGYIMRNFFVNNAVIQPLDLLHTTTSDDSMMRLVNEQNELRAQEGREPINIIKPMRGDTMTIGEGDEAVEIFFLNPGDYMYGGLTFEAFNTYTSNIKYGTGRGNASSITAKMTYKGQSYVWGGDISSTVCNTILKSYGEEFLDCDVLKLNHHGYTGNNPFTWLNACDPAVVMQNLVALYNPTTPHKYCEINNTGGFAEEVYKDGELGHIKVTLDGTTITAETMLTPRAYERNTDEYKNAKANYETSVESVLQTREALTVVADGGTAPYGTPYVWQSYANYIDSQLDELTKRGYLANATGELLEDYTAKIDELAQFIEDATMYGGSDVTPDVEVPGTQTGGTDDGNGSVSDGETGGIPGGTPGGIMGDIGGGNAGDGIGGGAGAAVGGGPAGPGGPVIDDGDDSGETTDPVVDDRRFIDVAETDWFNEAVNYVADNNYFNGVSEKEFAPSGTMTRAMLVTVIGRMSGADVTGEDNVFTDVDESSWYAEFVAWASANGIVTGVGDNKFAPEANVTREQIAAILMRFAQYKKLDTSVNDTSKYDSMNDTQDISEYAVEAMKWATSHGVINGSNGRLNPKGLATRAEVAQMIKNFCNTFAI